MSNFGVAARVPNSCKILPINKKYTKWFKQFPISQKNPLQSLFSQSIPWDYSFTSFRRIISSRLFCVILTLYNFASKSKCIIIKKPPYYPVASSELLLFKHWECFYWACNAWAALQSFEVEVLCLFGIYFEESGKCIEGSPTQFRLGSRGRPPLVRPTPDMTSLNN